ncbi:Embryonic polarity protein dorsal, partial [Fragariocoptes setiger]
MIDQEEENSMQGGMQTLNNHQLHDGNTMTPVALDDESMGGIVDLDNNCQITYRQQSPLTSPPIMNGCTNRNYEQLPHSNYGQQNMQMTGSPQAANTSIAKPYVRIVEQPAKRARRFRYACESRSAGSWPGVNSCDEQKTYPAIQIMNYVGRAVVVVSCVTKEYPFRPHPHKLVGKEGCKNGICTMVLNGNNDGENKDMICTFTNLGIQCVKRKEIEESLKLRESKQVDPFRTGFAHKSRMSDIDLSALRLCFQVFIEVPGQEGCTHQLVPVVSDVIHDKKAMSDLIITKLSHVTAPATGGREIIMLCDKVSRDDIQIRFYEERDGKLVWETYSEFEIHKQVAICIKTPKYYDESIQQPVIVRVQLRRPSDNQVSEPMNFQFLPCESDDDIIARKRPKVYRINLDNYVRTNIIEPHQLEVQAQAQAHQHQAETGHVKGRHTGAEGQHRHQHMLQTQFTINQQATEQQQSPVIQHQPPSLIQRSTTNDLHLLESPYQRQLLQQQQQSPLPLIGTKYSPSASPNQAISLAQQAKQYLGPEASANHSPSGHTSNNENQQRIPTAAHLQQSTIDLRRSPLNQGTGTLILVTGSAQCLPHIEPTSNTDAGLLTHGGQQQHTLQQQQRPPLERELTPTTLAQALNQMRASPTGTAQRHHNSLNSRSNTLTSEQLVVKHEIIDDEGKVIQIVDRPSMTSYQNSRAATNTDHTSGQAQGPLRHLNANLDQVAQQDRREPSPDTALSAKLDELAFENLDNVGLSFNSSIIRNLDSNSGGGQAVRVSAGDVEDFFNNAVHHHHHHHHHHQESNNNIDDAGEIENDANNTSDCTLNTPHVSEIEPQINFARLPHQSTTDGRTD